MTITTNTLWMLVLMIMFLTSFIPTEETRISSHPKPDLSILDFDLDFWMITVKEGDTLAGISKEFQVTPEKILAANPGMNANELQVGETLAIPKETV